MSPVSVPLLSGSPSDTFWRQLELYHNANGKVSLKDKSTRRFYMERTVSTFMSALSPPSRPYSR